MIQSDSTYAINATIGTDSGPCNNLQLYSRIRVLLKEFKSNLQSSATCSENQRNGAILSAVPTLLIQKVKGHAGIRGNEKADLLAQRGQYEVCKSGRYSMLSQSKSPLQYVLHNSSKFCSSVENSPSIQNSKHSDKKHNVHEMPAVIQFPSIHGELPSSFLRENLNSSSSASQTHYSRNSDEIYSDQEISIFGQSQFSHDSLSKQQEQQSPASNQSLSPRASRQSSPALHPFGLEDY